MDNEKFKQTLMKIEDYWYKIVTPNYVSLKEELSLLEKADEKIFNRIKKDLAKVYDKYHWFILDSFQEKLDISQQHALYNYTFTMRKNHKANLCEFEILFEKIKNKQIAIQDPIFLNTPSEQLRNFEGNLDNGTYTSQSGFTFFTPELDPTLSEQEFNVEQFLEKNYFAEPKK